MPTGIGMTGQMASFLKDWKQLVIRPLEFSFLGVAHAFLLATERIRAARGQTSPRKGYVVPVISSPAFRPSKFISTCCLCSGRTSEGAAPV